jgi:transposase InsO family protein
VNLGCAIATAGLRAQTHGFNLHAGVRCGAHQRKEVERLCRYFTRPAIANEQQLLRNATDWHEWNRTVRQNN